MNNSVSMMTQVVWFLTMAMTLGLAMLLWKRPVEAPVVEVEAPIPEAKSSAPVDSSPVIMRVRKITYPTAQSF